MVYVNCIGLAEWYEPNGGMFLWLKIIGLNDTKQLVHSRCLDKLLILAPGSALRADNESPNSYVRISYSIATPEEVELVSVFFYYCIDMFKQLYYSI